MSSQKKDLNKMRLDKFLCSCGIGTRNQVHKIIKDGRVIINDFVIKNKDHQVKEEHDIIFVDEERIIYEKYHYIMMNKPQGYVTSTADSDPTVMELLGEFKKYKVMPVGRLDKDTEGLLFFTNDGILSHNLTSPKKHVNKTYYVVLDKKISSDYIEIFKQGITLDDGYITMPSKLDIIDDYHIYLTIKEGKFHQVKRMMEAINNKVIYLKRITFGPLILDENLEIGKCRKLNCNEIELILEHKK